MLSREKSDCKMTRFAAIKGLAAMLLLLLLTASLSGCHSPGSHGTVSSPYQPHSASSSSAAAEVDDFSYSDFETSYPGLYAFSDSTVKENVYNESKVISCLDASQYVGQEVTVEGNVTTVYYASRSNGMPFFLNFGDNVFCVVIWEENQVDVDLSELGLLVDWTQEYGSIDLPMRVSGVVSMYDGEPQIVVRDGAQLAERMGEDESSPWMNFMSFEQMSEYSNLMDERRMNRLRL